MSEFFQVFLSTLATATASALVGLIWGVAREYVKNLRITRLNGVLGRAAGQVLDSVANSPLLDIASDALIQEAVRYVRRSYPDTLKKLGDPSDAHIAEMIRGEIGRIQATGTVPNA